MPYATQQDMIDRYGLPRLVQLTDVGEPLTGGLVDAVVDSRLADASAEIDGYLAGRVALPLTEPPAQLKNLCCRLAYGMLLGASATEADLADVKAARQYLTDVAKGTVLLAPPSSLPSVTGAGSVVFAQGDKVMGRETGRDTNGHSPDCLVGRDAWWRG